MEGHSVEQVQNRDKIKIKEIIKYRILSLYNKRYSAKNQKIKLQKNLKSLKNSWKISLKINFKC